MPRVYLYVSDIDFKSARGVLQELRLHGCDANNALPPNVFQSLGGAVATGQLAAMS